MFFNSLAFLIFLPCTLLGYYLLSQSYQNRLLLAASLFFYGCWDWRFIFLLLATIVVDFYVAAYLELLADRGASELQRKFLLAISMLTNLSVLGFFKYYDFFATGLNGLLSAMGCGVPIRTLNVVLPIGISFYTFQSMSYTIDVYRRELRAVRSFFDFALFVSFFPHLVAGPIMRAVDLLPQILEPRTVAKAQILDGLHLMLWGFWKKLFVADNLAPIVNEIFHKTDPAGFQTLMAVCAFAFQIYCDFSGYTDIARGVAKLMGFELVVNFNYPYISRNPQEFWTRWHISLSSWLKNYLYIPLGGSKCGTLRTYGHLMLTMVIGGLWHGAAWNFVLWGAYQGGLLVVYRFLAPLIGKVMPTPNWFRSSLHLFQRVLMFTLICYGWLLFRAGSVTQITSMTKSLLHPLSGWDLDLFSRITAFVMSLVLSEGIQAWYDELRFERGWQFPVEVPAVCYTVLMYLMVFRGARPQTFIYFQF